MTLSQLINSKNQVGFQTVSNFYFSDAKKADAKKEALKPKFTIGVLRETFLNEKRVAQTPDTVKSLVKDGHRIVLQSKAGEFANFSDEDYKAAGAEIVQTPEDVIKSSDVLFKVRQPDEALIEKMREKQTLFSFLFPGINKQLVEKITNKKVNSFAMDMVPRISRAQTYDALSSMANIAGYKAVI
jgi:NAD/NADP transhydrogenase alpha subunit